MVNWGMEDAGNGGSSVSRAVVVLLVGDKIFSESLPLASTPPPTSFFSPLSTSLADSFIYWGPRGSRNSFAVVLPLHTKRSMGER